MRTSDPKNRSTLGTAGFDQTAVTRKPRWEGAIQAWLDSKTREEGGVAPERTAMLSFMGAPSIPSEGSRRPATAMASVGLGPTQPMRFDRAPLISAGASRRKLDGASRRRTTDGGVSSSAAATVLTPPREGSADGPAALGVAEEEAAAAHGAAGGASLPADLAPREGDSMAEHVQAAKEADKNLQGQAQNLYLTTYNVTMGLRELRGAGEVYNDVVKYCRSNAPTQNPFRSMWGDSLKSGDTTEWKDKCLRTQYQVDSQRATDRLKESELQKQGRMRFLDWVKNSRLYYGEVFDDATCAKVDSWMDTASPEDRERFLQLMREVHSSIQPDRGNYKSHNTATYIKRANFDDSEINDLVARYSRFMAYGYPKQVVLRPFSAPVRSAASSEQAGCQGQGQGQGKNGSKKKKKGAHVHYKPPTYESNFSLDQPEAAAHAFQSTYRDTFQRQSRRLRVFQQMAVKTADPWGQSTQPFGRPNPHTIGPANIDVFAVPGHYLNIAGSGFGIEPRQDTTYLREYQNLARDPNRKDGYFAQLRGQAKERGERGKDTKSQIPLGRMGFRSMPTTDTTYQTDYTEPPQGQAKENTEHAKRLRDIAALPSVPVGSIAPNPPEPFLRARKKAVEELEAREKAHGASLAHLRMSDMVEGGVEVEA